MSWPKHLSPHDRTRPGSPTSRADRRRLAVSRRHQGSVHLRGRRPCDGRPDDDGFGVGCTQERPHHQAPRPRTASPFRSWCPVWCTSRCRVGGTVITMPPRKFLGHAEERTGASPARRYASTGPARDLGVHRALLQPAPAAFSAEESLAGGICPAVGPSLASGVRRQFMASTIDNRSQSAREEPKSRVRSCCE